LRSWKVHNKLELESDPIDRSIYTSSLNKTIRDCIERKLPDRLYNSLSKKDITTLANLKEAAMDLGHWDADPFDNNRPRRQDIRRNSGSTHQNYYYQKYNSHSHGYPRYNNNNNSRVITIQIIQQILKIHQIEIIFPLKTKVTIMSLGEI